MMKKAGAAAGIGVTRIAPLVTILAHVMNRGIRFSGHGHGLGLELDEFPFGAKGQQLALEIGRVIASNPR